MNLSIEEITSALENRTGKSVSFQDTVLMTGYGLIAELNNWKAEGKTGENLLYGTLTLTQDEQFIPAEAEGLDTQINKITLLQRFDAGSADVVAEELKNKDDYTLWFNEYVAVEDTDIVIRGYFKGYLFHIS